MTKYNSPRAARKAWKKRLEKEIAKKTVFIVQFQHDEWCGIYNGNECNCNPDRVLLDRNGKVFFKVSGAGFYDPMEYSG